jgi:hypothetical protein
MTSRLRKHCQDGHHPWPAKGRYSRYVTEISRRTQEDSFAADVGSLRPTEPKGRRRRLGLVDLDTGEITPLERACPSGQARASSNSHGPNGINHGCPPRGRAKLGIAESQRAPTNR